MSDETITAWITKYALSGGIKVESVEVSGAHPNMVVRRSDYGGAYFHGEGKEWHRTAESAIARAEKMRLDKIASLKKQIAKLERMTFAAATQPAASEGRG